MQITTQYLQDKRLSKPGKVEVILTGQNATEKALLGALFELSDVDREMQDGGSLSLVFSNPQG